MPVVGTLCCRTGEPARFNDCIGCALTGKPERCKHPVHVLEAMRSNESGREGAGLSVTTLLGCHRKGQLHQRYDYYEDPKEMEARFKGTLVHEGMERMLQGYSNVIQEVRYGRTVVYGDPMQSYYRMPVQHITGKMDLILPDFDGGARIIDFKSAGRRKLGPDMVPSESHVEQVNVYRWILEDGYEVEYDKIIDGFEGGYGEVRIQRKVQMQVGSAAILYIGDTAMQEVEIPLWPLDMTQAFVEQKVREYTSKALAPILPDRVYRKRSTAKDPVIVWDDDDIPAPDPGGIVVEPHYFCTTCALFDLCRSLPREGIDWESDGDY